MSKPNTVPVIASFDSGGHVRPLYVRVNGVSLKVHSCWLKASYGNIMEFSCQVIDGDLLKPLILTFFRTDHVWTVDYMIRS